MRANAGSWTRRTGPGYRFRGGRAQAAPLAAPLALGAGGLLGLAHLPFEASWIVVLPLALVLWLIAREETPRLAARTAFFAGLAFWAVHLFWLPQSFSGLLGPVMWAIMPLLWLGEAVFWAAAGWVAHLLGRRTLPTIGTLACSLLVLEWLRGLGPLAFPWGNFGYALVDTPLAQVASLGGVSLASLLVIGLAAALAALSRFELRPLALMGLAWLAAYGYGVSRPAPPAPTEQAHLVQGNIDVLGRTRGIGQEDLQVYRGLSRRAGTGALVVWPEGAVQLADALRTGYPRLLTGTYQDVDGYPTNVVASISNGRLVSASAKVRPVPFGEFFPWRTELAFIYDPLFTLIGLPGYRSARLGAATAPLSAGPDRAGAYVCYDSVFPSAARAFVRNGANLLVNVSNDGWFGDTWGIYQHFAMGRMRAIEGDRYLLRAGNTGITAVIDPRGRVLARLPRGVAGALPVRYARITTLTPYARLGDWPVLVAVVAGLGFARAGWRSRRLF